MLILPSPINKKPEGSKQRDTSKKHLRKDGQYMNRIPPQYQPQNNLQGIQSKFWKKINTKWVTCWLSVSTMMMTNIAGRTQKTANTHIVSYTLSQ